MSFDTPFYQIAGELNHDQTLLQQDHEIITYPRIATLEQARAICNRASPEVRKKRSQVFYLGLENRQRLPLGIHDRTEEFVYAAGKVHPQDISGISNHLPLPYKLLSVKEKTVKANQIWDLSVHHEQWGLDYKDDLYTVINIDTLILEPGAKVVIQGNVLTLSCQNVIRLGQASSDYDIAILPTPFSVDRRKGEFHGLSGKAGQLGRNGHHGLSCDVEASIFGPRWVNREVEDKLDGESGCMGTNGQNGCHGLNGGVVKLAEIYINHLVGFEKTKLRIFTQAGKGGNGGNGGNGGASGKGGDGGEGVELAQLSISPGSGAQGGAGGLGGRGGRAGNGGISSNIFIEVPQTLVEHVKVTALSSESGKPGTGGAGGVGAVGGQAANGSRLYQGCNGLNGVDGQPGNAGKSRPAGRVFINSKPYDSYSSSQGTRG